MVETSHSITPISTCQFRQSVYFFAVIENFADQITGKIFRGEELSRKEYRELRDLNIVRAFERLAILNRADEKTLRQIPFLHYHKLHGTSRYSIDADSRKSKWRITFKWKDEEMVDVTLVRIEDTH